MNINSDSYERRMISSREMEWAREHLLQFDLESKAIYQDKNPVIKACEALQSYIQEFEQRLDEEHEVGVRLVSFGSEVKFHVHYIGFSPPNIITFYGVTANGEDMQLIQHVSQLSFLLMAVKKIGDKPQRIGFRLNN